MERIALGMTITLVAGAGSASAGVPPPQPQTVLWALTQADLSCRLDVHPDAVHLLGDFITIRNGCTGTTQTVYQRGGFWTVTLASGAERERRILGSGPTFPRSSSGSGMLRSRCCRKQWRRRPRTPSRSGGRKMPHPRPGATECSTGSARATGGPGSPAQRSERRSSTE